MDLDSKQKVLMAIYIEYQKDYPDYENAVYNPVFAFSADAVLIALKKLQNEGLIAGFEWRMPDGSCKCDICNMMLTPAGQSYVETKLSVDPLASGKEKLGIFTNYAIKIGWKAASDIAAKIIAEMATK